MNNANETMPTDPDERNRIKEEITKHFEAVLRALRIKTDTDPNTKGTAKRVAKMFVDETFRGRFHPPPEVTAFPNTNKAKPFFVGPITLRSCCAHHFCPIVGQVFLCIAPGATLLGLSKYNRLVDWVASRPTIQEDLTEQIADTINAAAECEGLAVLVRARHLCMTWRGVEEHGDAEMSTTTERGALSPSVVNDFFAWANRFGVA